MINIVLYHFKLLLHVRRQNVPVKVKIGCISCVLILIYILCLDRQVHKKSMENASKCCRNTLPDPWDNLAFSGIFLGKGNIVLIKIIVFFSLEFLITAIYVVRGVSLIFFWSQKAKVFKVCWQRCEQLALEKLYTRK